MKLYCNHYLVGDFLLLGGKSYFIDAVFIGALGEESIISLKVNHRTTTYYGANVSAYIVPRPFLDALIETGYAVHYGRKETEVSEIKESL